MLDDVGEGYDSCPALGDVKPVAGPGGIHDIRLAAQPDVQAVNAVIEDGDEDEGPFEHADQGQGIEELDLRGIGHGAFEGFEIGEDVLDEEGTDRDDSGQRVQPAPDEGVPLAGTDGLDP